MIIPTKVLEILTNYIKSDISFSKIKEKQNQKLLKVLIELWYFIYNQQITDNKSENFHYYTNINKCSFISFSFMYNGQRLQYKKLLNILRLSNLISINEKYSENNFTKSYKININNILGDYTEFELNFSKIFNNTNNKEYWLKKYSSKSNLINDCYNSSIDLNQYLNWLISNRGLELKPVLNKSNGRLEKRFLTDDRIWLHFNLALKINFKNLWFKVSNEGRFYSSVSNLPYTAVPFLKLYNQNTQEFDVKNSQPLLLSLLIENNEYKKDVVDGIFYEKLASELGYSRNDTKILSYKYIFFNLKPLKSGKIYDAMKKLYGSFIDDINNLKSNIKLSHKLQEIEADIFVNKLGSLKISKLLRHDQIIVMENDIEIIKNYIKIEYNKLGLNINVD